MRGKCSKITGALIGLCTLGLFVWLWSQPPRGTPDLVPVALSMDLARAGYRHAKQGDVSTTVSTEVETPALFTGLSNLKLKSLSSSSPAVSKNAHTDTVSKNAHTDAVSRNTHTDAVSRNTHTDTPNTLQGAQMDRSKLAMNLVVLHFMAYTHNAPEQRILDREQEYMTTLQINLNHSLVARVHILTTDSQATEKRLADFDLPNRNKILISEVKTADSMRDMFDYISKYLVGQDVMYMNGDIYLTDGFDLVDSQAMRQRHIIYALTRRGTQEAKCKMQDYCGVDIKHAIGSHDAFLFHLTEPMPEGALQDLNYPLGSWGSENVLLWVFQRKLRYCVLNPCSILKAYHLHCSNLRSRGKIRVNVGGKSVSAGFTNKLVC